MWAKVGAMSALDTGSEGSPPNDGLDVEPVLRCLLLLHGSDLLQAKLFRGVLYRYVCLRVFRLWLGIHGLFTFNMAAEAKAHGREHLFAEGMLLPRAETGVERRGDHIRGNRFRQPERVWISACSRLSHPAGLSEIESGLF